MAAEPIHLIPDACSDRTLCGFPVPARSVLVEQAGTIGAAACVDCLKIAVAVDQALAAFELPPGNPVDGRDSGG